MIFKLNSKKNNYLNGLIGLTTLIVLKPITTENFNNQLKISK